MSSRTYGQYCPVAQALDEIGDRWVLLILRDLSFGPQRFTDLRDSLVGLAPNLLTERLRSLEEGGLVVKEDLPPPAARSVYVLTESGKTVIPVLGALARFGAGRLPIPDDDTVVRPRAALITAITTHHRPEQVVNASARYRFIMDGQSFDIEAATGRVRQSEDTAAPAVTVTATPKALIALRLEDRPFKSHVADGDIALTGTKAAIREFRATFDL